ncbi:MAG TPA: hypothetical protein VGE52_18955, partial [Pirellulales bacterium]
LGNGPLATLLKSQSLRVPIGGTLKQPKVQVERLGEVNSGLTHDMAGVLERGLSVGDEWAKGMGDRVRSGSGLLDVMRGLVEPNGDANNSPTGTPSPSGAADPNGAPAQPDLGERLLEGLGDRLRKRFGRDEPAPADDPPR